MNIGIIKMAGSLMDQTGCSFEEIIEFLKLESGAFLQDEVIHTDGNGDGYIDLDEMNSRFCSEAGKLSAAQLEKLERAQLQFLNESSSDLACDFKNVYNLFHTQSCTGIEPGMESFFQMGAEYQDHLMALILKDSLNRYYDEIRDLLNEGDVIDWSNDLQILERYMNLQGYTQDEEGFWQKSFTEN